jgi:putative ABC transport system permease protein
MHYLQTKDLGYNKDQVIIVPTNKGRKEGFALAQLYKNELQKHSELLNVSTAAYSFAETPWATLGFKDDKNIYRSFRFNQVDPYFVDAMKIKMVQGRSFQPNNTVDFNNSAIVNEALVKEFGLKDPVGKKFGSYTQTIIGVMKDFNYESLHTAVQPLVLAPNGDTMFRQSSDVSFAISPQPRISVRLKPGNVSDQINMLKKAWKKVAPNQDFEYHFLDETLAASYNCLPKKISPTISC